MNEKKYGLMFLGSDTVIPGDADQISGLLDRRLGSNAKIPLTDKILRSKVGCGTMAIMVARLIGTSTIVAVGTVSKVNRLRKNQSEIHDVATHEDHERQGLCRSIMAHLIRRAKNGYSADQIVLTSSPKREAANYLYQSLGFVRRDTNYYELNG